MDKNTKFISDTETIDDDFDLRLFWKFCIRNKFFILLISFFTVVTSHFYSKTITRVWEGEFQIVLDSDGRSGGSLQNNTALGGLGAILGDIGYSDSSSLETQVGILESPSVLKPVFEFANLEKKKINGSYSASTFSLWKTNALRIDLKKGTSILNISYRDTDKDLIIPVLKNISSAYQNYSGKNKRRNFELLNSFLNEQIKFYKDKSSKSLRKTQAFAIDQDLNLMLDASYVKNRSSFKGMFDPSSSNSSQNNSLQLLSNADIENIRINASNKIRKIDNQIEKINNLDDDDDDQVPYLKMLVANSDSIGFTKKIDDIEFKIVDIKSKYTGKDKSIERLNDFKKLLIKEQKIKLINFLKAQRIQAEALRESATRPKGVILQYKELLREANRDESTLIILENQLRKNELEKSRYEDPWELITSPTLKPFPVKPNTKQIRIIGAFIGLFGALLSAFIKEKRSGYIFTTIGLEKLLNSKIIGIFHSEKNSLKNKFILDVLKINKKTSILNFDLSQSNIKELKECMQISKVENPIYSDLDNIKEKTIFILISLDSKLKNLDVKNLRHILVLKDIEIEGVILVKNTFDKSAII